MQNLVNRIFFGTHNTATFVMIIAIYLSTIIAVTLLTISYKFYSHCEKIAAVVCQCPKVFVPTPIILLLYIIFRKLI